MFRPLPPPAQRYWRGPVLSRFDGREWSVLLRPGAGTLTPWRAGGIGYSVTLEPHGKPWLFALDLPASLPRPAVDDAAAAAGYAILTRDQQLIARAPVAQVIRYEQLSMLRDAFPPFDDDDGRDALRLPSRGNPRTVAFAQGLRARHADDRALVHAVLAMFRDEDFTYTLAPGVVHPRDPVDGFLFDSRRGFCEHYASSFALLMRIAGIPARIVMGFLGGERNPLGAHLIVRQSDAHAWVEVWLDGQGWTRIDPTAAVAPERIEPSPELTGLARGRPLRLRIGGVDTWGRLVHGLRLFGDALDENWYRWVLGLDRARQQALLDSIGLGWLREYGLAALLVMASSLVMGLLLVALLHQPASARFDPLERLYRKFCARLARAGLPRKASEGPCAYGHRLALWNPGLAVGFLAFTQRYARLRYGRGPVGQGDLDLLRRELQAILDMLRKARR